MSFLNSAVSLFREKSNEKINVIWLEATGCSGNIISLLNASEPDAAYFFKEMVNLTYSNSIMFNQGENAFNNFLDTLNTEFILIVEGAIATKDNGKYTIIAEYQGTDITALNAVTLAGEKAKYVLAMGTCAYSGGISAASPNLSGCKSVSTILKREVINLPGCPCNPDWLLGTIARIGLYGKPELDSKNRPLIFYKNTIHDNCPRRIYFDNNQFAQKPGDKECMFKLGCRGPITHTDCPTRQWNNHSGWPIGCNTPCIGCAHEAFPNGMEPFIRE